MAFLNDVGNALWNAPLGGGFWSGVMDQGSAALNPFDARNPVNQTVSSITQPMFNAITGKAFGQGKLSQSQVEYVINEAKKQGLSSDEIDSLVNAVGGSDPAITDVNTALGYVSQRAQQAGQQNTINSLINQYTGPGSYNATQIDRLTNILRDPAAMRTDAEFGKFLADIDNQTIAAENQANREAGSRSVQHGLGFSGKGMLDALNARSTGMLARSEAMGTARQAAQSELTGLNQANQTYATALKTGFMPTPYDWGEAGANKMGLTGANLGQQNYLLGTGANILTGTMNNMMNMGTAGMSMGMGLLKR